MLVKKKSTILNFIFSWVYLEKYCGSYRENFLSSLLLLLQLTLWKFGIWVQTHNVLAGFYFAAFLSGFLFEQGDCANRISTLLYKQNCPCSLSVLFSLVFCHFSFFIPLCFIPVEFTGITLVGNWDKSVILRMSVASWPCLLRIWASVEAPDMMLNALSIHRLQLWCVYLDFISSSLIVLCSSKNPLVCC